MRHWLVAAMVLLACSDPTPVSENSGSIEAAHPPSEPAELDAAAAPALVERGRALVGEYECNRCHEIEGIAPATAERDCAGCHRRLHDRASDPTTPPGEPVPRVHALIDVPSLRATDRFRRDGLAAFLAHPVVVRPNGSASMPTFRLPPEHAAAIAAFLVPSAEHAPEHAVVGDVERGRAVVAANGCGSCHRMSGVGLPATPLPIALDAAAFSSGQTRAPDLARVRERLRPAALAAWLRDPAAVKADAAMPKIPLDEQAIADVIAFLVNVPLAPVPPDVVPARLPVLSRRVGYEEVHERVFGKICRHCHADPEVIGGGGPGFAGGFGFRERRLDLSTYEGLRSGSLDDAGKLRSVFAPLPDGTPRLIAHLMARHAEVADQEIPGIRGMPLALPPLPLEDIQLIESWIAQGRRR